ncbi:hypothetical protein NDU88_000464 [Pleurodeles waltl]|uniref:Uncharacterized protein n=1 Tax=Pleurodeles waltl TaxID=8319 RepID=A0AAV7VYH7_PLEWA|nr:hypothetical protein NDU88_000464 [Pleurodeles waltl]
MGKPKKREGQAPEDTDGTQSAGRPQRIDPRDGSADQETTLDMVLQAIRESREALEQKIDNLTVDLSLLRDDHRRLTERV